MHALVRIAVILFAAIVPSNLIAAEPDPKPELSIAFLPPTDRQLTYLREEVDQKDSKEVIERSVDRFSFTPDGDGYILTVVPVSSTTTETDPDILRLREVTQNAVGNRPYSLVVNNQAQITELVDGEKYWSTILSVIRSQLESKAESPDVKRARSTILNQLEKSTPETRLAMMVQDIQPLVEFAFTELDPDNPIKLQIESGTVVGGKVLQDVAIASTRPVNGIVHISVTHSVPRKEFERLTADLLRTSLSLDKSKVAELEKEIAALKDMRSETVTDYWVEQETGILQDYRYVRTVVVADAGAMKTRITKTRMSLQK